VVAFQCLSGYRPFKSENPLEIEMRHVSEQPPPMPPDAPPVARAVVERAMNKRPADRYPNAAVFAQEARLVAAQLSRKPISPTAGPVRRALSAILDWGGRATRT
jgi:serine/threonine-protein kinase